MTKPLPASRKQCGTKKAAVPRGAEGLSKTRLRTRRRIVDAALIVMGEKGVDGTSIAEVTVAADVGFGSFYANFRTIEELAKEVFAIRAEVIARQLNAINERVRDPALAASFIQRWFIETAIHDRVWGWFLIHADAALQQAEVTFRERIRADIARGIEEGRYSVKALDAAVTITLASLVAAMRRILEGKSRPTLANEIVELLLRQYGLEADEARQLSREKLPAWISTAD